MNLAALPIDLHLLAGCFPFLTHPFARALLPALRFLLNLFDFLLQLLHPVHVEIPPGCVRSHSFHLYAWIFHTTDFSDVR